MRFLKVILLSLSLCLSSTILGQDSNPTRKAPKKEIKLSKRSSRNLPKINKSRISKLKKLLRKKKTANLRKTKRKTKKLVAKNTKKKKFRFQRQRRLRALKLAQDRLRDQATNSTD